MITRKDVAERANVSVTIVSRVLNNSGYVAKEKREAVRRAVKELKYQPNPVAVSLKKNRTRQILFYVNDLSNYFYMELYQGMMAYALKKDYLIVMSGELNPSQIGRIMIDGMILPNEFYSADAFTEEFYIPVVVASHGTQINHKFTNVDANTAVAMQKAITYLRSKGHIRIAYAAKFRTDYSDPRHQTFRELMSCVYGDRVMHYIMGRKEEELEEGVINYFESGRHAARYYIDQKIDATAIISFNDDTAIGLMSEFYRHGIRVPDAVSVIGIDGQMEGMYSSPPLTSVSLNPYEQGRKCAEILIRQIEMKKNQKDYTEQPQIIDIPIELIERSSVIDINQQSLMSQTHQVSVS